MRLSNLRSPSRTAGTSRAATALVLVAVLALAGCGDDATGTAEPESPEESASSSSPASTSPSESPSSSEPAPSSKPSKKPSKKPSQSTAPSPAGLVVDVTVQGDQVSPQAEVLEADIDKPITLQIQSDRAGEMHVHSSPEQYVDFGPGRTTAEIRFENPGAIDVEEHETGALVLKILVQ